MLNLPEILTLLSYDERGRNQIVVGTEFNACLAGGALLELAWAGKVAVTPEQVTVLDPQPLGNPTLDHVLATVAAGPPRSPGQWTCLSRSPLPELRAHCRQALVDQGLMQARARRVLFLFPGTAYVPDFSVWQALASEARGILQGPLTDDLRRQVLGALVDLASLTWPLIPSPPEFHPARERARELRTQVLKAEVEPAVRLLMLGVEAAKDQSDSSASGM